MKIYFAPLEGITGYVFRNSYHKVFEAEKNIIDKYNINIGILNKLLYN